MNELGLSANVIRNWDKIERLMGECGSLTTFFDEYSRLLKKLDDMPLKCQECLYWKRADKPYHCDDCKN